MARNHEIKIETTEGVEGSPEIGQIGDDSEMGIEAMEPGSDPDSDPMGDPDPDDDPDQSPSQSPSSKKRKSRSPKSPSQDQSRFNSRGQVLKRLLDQIEHEYHFALDASGQLYRYQSGCYRPDGELWSRNWLMTKMRNNPDLLDLWSIGFMQDFLAALRCNKPKLWPEPPTARISLLNGILDLPSRSLSPHTPDFYSPIQLPLCYVPGAKCPEWDQYLASLFPMDAIQLAHEILGAILTPNRIDQVAIWIKAPGGNGKSTFLESLNLLLGPHNIARVSIKELSQDRFAAADLDGKLLNVDADATPKSLEDPSILKKVIGFDQLRVQRKHQPAYDIVPFAKLIIAGNFNPSSGDWSYGWLRRFLIVPFAANFVQSDDQLMEIDETAKRERIVEKGSKGKGKVNGVNGMVNGHSTTNLSNPSNQIPLDRRDKTAIFSRLSNPMELSGILNHALDGLDRIKSNGHFSIPESVQQATRDFQSEADPILKAWQGLFHCQSKDEILDRDLFLSKEEIVDSLNAVLPKRVKGHGGGLTTKELNGWMGRNFSHLIQTQRRIDGKVVRGYIGIGYLEDREVNRIEKLGVGERISVESVGRVQ